MPYTTTIVPLLILISGFDKAKGKIVEKRLIKALEDVGCSESRYRRFKTDQDHSTPLKFVEVNAIYEFFRNEVVKAIAQADDIRMNNTLQLWLPQQVQDVYQPMQMQQEA